MGHFNYKLKDGWISKGIRLIEEDPKGFAGKDADVYLGVSNTMAASIKYWLQATGVAKSGHGGMKFTPFGDILRKKDRYLEERLSIYLLHRNLLAGGKFPVATDFFESEIQVITRENLAEWLLRDKKDMSADTITGEVSMLAQTYAGIRSGDPEDNNYCPLSDLHLVKRDKATIRKTMPNIKLFPEKLLLLEIEDLTGKGKSVSFEKIGERMKHYYNLPFHVCYDMANKLEASDYITFTKTAGINQIYKKDFPKNVLEFLYDDMIK